MIILSRPNSIVIPRCLRGITQLSKDRPKNHPQTKEGEMWSHEKVTPQYRFTLAHPCRIRKRSLPSSTFGKLTILNISCPRARKIMPSVTPEYVLSLRKRGWKVRKCVNQNGPSCKAAEMRCASDARTDLGSRLFIIASRFNFVVKLARRGHSGSIIAGCVLLTTFGCYVTPLHARSPISTLHDRVCRRKSRRFPCRT